MAPHSSALAWKTPWTEEPGGLQSMGSHRVGHDWSDLEAAAAAVPILPPYLFSTFLGGYVHLFTLSDELQNQLVELQNNLLDMFIGIPLKLTFNLGRGDIFTILKFPIHEQNCFPFIWSFFYIFKERLLIVLGVRNPPTNAPDVRDSLGLEDALKEGLATHSSILAWRIPWTQEPGGYSPQGQKELDTTEAT